MSYKLLIHYINIGIGLGILSYLLDGDILTDDNLISNDNNLQINNNN